MRPEHWMRGEAPLGMTPAVYREWRSSLLDVLHREGVPADAVDVRLLGSGSEGFSGPRKPMWRADDPAIAGSAAGFFVHFRDDYDWIVHRSQEGG